MAAAIASYVAAFQDHSARLSPGEVGFVLVLAASKDQANVVFGYVKAFFEGSAILRQLIEDVTAQEIRLRGNVVVAVHSSSHRTVRGRTLLACIFDEVGFWRDENSSQPDLEVYRAVLPALATTGGMLVGISSPYWQRGLLFQKHQKCFGRDDADVLVIQAGTVTFNPQLDASVIAQAEEDDPEAAQAEWHGLFRSDLSTFIDRKIVERCVDTNVRERPFIRTFRHGAFCDPSGGQHDSFALGLSHREGDRLVLDVTREWRAPFSPADVVAEAVGLLRAYKISSITGDRYASGWCEGEFRKHGIRYVASERSRSEIYLDSLPLLMSETAVLLDDARLISQISQLERRTSRGGRDSVDHPRGGADDLCNAALGALLVAQKLAGSSGAGIDRPPPGYTGQVSDPLGAYRLRPAGGGVVTVRPTHVSGAQLRRY
jgi:hypothetical protein